ncbi:hypothetical protein JB92DRAFT_2834877 [Gautieria morchelliformis]|nr:hypothetical protein JB92DRAFT_2834877 [Gautieria morchelliformis]
MGTSWAPVAASLTLTPLQNPLHLLFDQRIKIHIRKDIYSSTSALKSISARTSVPEEEQGGHALVQQQQHLSRRHGQNQRDRPRADGRALPAAALWRCQPRGLPTPPGSGAAVGLQPRPPRCRRRSERPSTAGPMRTLAGAAESQHQQPQHAGQHPYHPHPRHQRHTTSAPRGEHAEPEYRGTSEGGEGARVYLRLPAGPSPSDPPGREGWRMSAGVEVGGGGFISFLGGFLFGASRVVPGMSGGGASPQKYRYLLESLFSACNPRWGWKRLRYAYGLVPFLQSTMVFPIEAFGVVGRWALTN